MTNRSDEEPEFLDPEQIIRDLNRAANNLGKAATALARQIREFEGSIDPETGEVRLGIESRYEIAIDEALEEIVKHYEDEGKRPPAEDIRQARARKMVRTHDEELYVTYLQAATEIKAMRMWIASEREVISARQSVLNGLKAVGA